MDLSNFYLATPRERRQQFFTIANKVGLVIDGHYISGIPQGNEEDINLFYTLEDKLEYPKPCKIPKNYLSK